MVLAEAEIVATLATDKTWLAILDEKDAGRCLGERPLPAHA
jgi:hypothetical protein